MGQRLIFLLKIYAWFLLVFILQKPLFMIYHAGLYTSFDMTDWLRVMWHGLPLDLSLSAYILFIPALIAVLSVWIQGRWIYLANQLWLIPVCIVSSVIFICDAELYSYWGFRMDATPLFYLSSPADAMASVPMAALILVPLCIIVYFLLIWYPLSRFVLSPTVRWKFIRRRGRDTVVLLLITALLIIPARGGFSVSTMNIGKVYFSPEISLNHAAINPVFSFMTSISKGQDFKKQYRYMDEDQAEKEFERLKGGNPYTVADSLLWIQDKRPNVLMIILESFSGIAMDSLYAEAPGGIMPNLDKLASEGIFFTNFYANSFRTDRGLVSILSGYPAQPTTSIMKYPSKSQSLPSIARTLQKNGYDTEFLYGGDADFTNMRSYFIGTGFKNIVCDKDFPVADRLSKWGANDEVTFNKLRSLIANQKERPYMKAFLTISSHEPFDVPYHKFKDPYLNSVAYTDSCIGVFIDDLKKTPEWKNTLVIFVPDHAMRYPVGIQESDILRHYIPMIWTGGAVSKPRVVSEYGSQIDIAATLLGQLGLPYDDFTFSKNMADPVQRKFAYYTFKDGFGFLDADNQVIYDNEAGKAIFLKGANASASELAGKAFLQKLYDDLGSR
ncbi:LTA synthase family protein [Coprobacter tertius]|uniref:Sulfatase-like hydrolase/transferase n=1 Tax=Coprobacter tertius TaxID=2944915 RepID=A0ABT1MET7_9BACT|nr:alkaline phosphatase family protein [Coprobacter tertius]MCP9611140.1 sulfatase-like hydrolase/transferase [Coprobacter tertius]